MTVQCVPDLDEDNNKQWGLCRNHSSLRNCQGELGLSMVNLFELDACVDVRVLGLGTGYGASLLTVVLTIL